MSDPAHPAPRGGTLPRLGRVLFDTYRKGGRALVAAPAIAAIAIVPEAVQHVAEIRLGMFDTVDRFRALSADPTRWAFGYMKVAGFVLAILAFARFVALGSVRRAVLPPPGDLGRLVLAIAAGFAVDWPLQQAALASPPVVAVAVRVVSAVLQAGILVWTVAALLGDRSTTLLLAFRLRWPTGLVMVAACAAAFVPAQAMHMANHRLAIGATEPVVWAVMAFDSLLLGLFASLVGAAIASAYAAGLTWRGWSSPVLGA